MNITATLLISLIVVSFFYKDASSHLQYDKPLIFIMSLIIPYVSYKNYLLFDIYFFIYYVLLITWALFYSSKMDDEELEITFKSLLNLTDLLNLLGVVFIQTYMVHTILTFFIDDTLNLVICVFLYLAFLVLKIHS